MGWFLLGIIIPYRTWLIESLLNSKSYISLKLKFVLETPLLTIFHSLSSKIIGTRAYRTNYWKPKWLPGQPDPTSPASCRVQGNEEGSTVIWSGWLFVRVTTRITFGRASMSAQIPSITVTSIDTTSTSGVTKVTFESDTLPDEAPMLGSSTADGDQAKLRMRWECKIAKLTWRAQEGVWEKLGCGQLGGIGAQFNDSNHSQ